MAKEQRHGNREARKPKTVKAVAAAPISPFVKKNAAAVEAPPKRNG